MKEKAKPEILYPEKAPTKETHPQYDFIYGPFKTVEDAQRLCQCNERVSLRRGLKRDYDMFFQYFIQVFPLLHQLLTSENPLHPHSLDNSLHFSLAL
jgi:hypothetical protein